MGYGSPSMLSNPADEGSVSPARSFTMLLPALVNAQALFELQLFLPLLIRLTYRYPPKRSLLSFLPAVGLVSCIVGICFVGLSFATALLGEKGTFRTARSIFYATAMACLASVLLIRTRQILRRDARIARWSILGLIVSFLTAKLLVSVITDPQNLLPAGRLLYVPSGANLATTAITILLNVLVMTVFVRDMMHEKRLQSSAIDLQGKWRWYFNTARKYALLLFATSTLLRFIHLIIPIEQSPPMISDAIEVGIAPLIVYAMHSVVTITTGNMVFVIDNGREWEDQYVRDRKDSFSSQGSGRELLRDSKIAGAIATLQADRDLEKSRVHTAAGKVQSKPVHQRRMQAISITDSLELHWPQGDSISEGHNTSAPRHVLQERDLPLLPNDATGPASMTSNRDFRSVIYTMPTRISLKALSLTPMDQERPYNYVIEKDIPSDFPPGSSHHMSMRSGIRRSLFNLFRSSDADLTSLTLEGAKNQVDANDAGLSVVKTWTPNLMRFSRLIPSAHASIDATSSKPSNFEVTKRPIEQRDDIGAQSRTTSIKFVGTPLPSQSSGSAEERPLSTKASESAGVTAQNSALISKESSAVSKTENCRKTSSKMMSPIIEVSESSTHPHPQGDPPFSEPAMKNHRRDPSTQSTLTLDSHMSLVHRKSSSHGNMGNRRRIPSKEIDAVVDSAAKQKHLSLPLNEINNQRRKADQVQLQELRKSRQDQLLALHEQLRSHTEDPQQRTVNMSTLQPSTSTTMSPSTPMPPTPSRSNLPFVIPPRPNVKSPTLLLRNDSLQTIYSDGHRHVFPTPPATVTNDYTAISNVMLSPRTLPKEYMSEESTPALTPTSLRRGFYELNDISSRTSLPSAAPSSDVLGRSTDSNANSQTATSGGSSNHSAFSTTESGLGDMARAIDHLRDVNVKQRHRRKTSRREFDTRVESVPPSLPRLRDTLSFGAKRESKRDSRRERPPDIIVERTTNRLSTRFDDVLKPHVSGKSKLTASLQRLSQELDELLEQQKTTSDAIDTQEAKKMTYSPLLRDPASPFWPYDPVTTSRKSSTRSNSSATTPTRSLGKSVGRDRPKRLTIIGELEND